MIQKLNAEIDKAILKNDQGEFRRLAKLHRQLTINHLNVYVHYKRGN